MSWINQIINASGRKEHGTLPSFKRMRSVLNDSDLKEMFSPISELDLKLDASVSLSGQFRDEDG